MGVELRDAIPEDVEAIRDCYVRSWRRAYEGELSSEQLDAQSAARSRFDWERLIRSPTSSVHVAVDIQTGIVGVVATEEELPPPRDLPEIIMLYVDPAAWGTGAALALTDAATDWLASRGHHGARVRFVAHHDRTRRFYEREGWEHDELVPPVRTDLAQLVYYRKALRRR